MSTALLYFLNYCRHVSTSAYVQIQVKASIKDEEQCFEDIMTYLGGVKGLPTIRHIPDICAFKDLQLLVLDTNVLTDRNLCFCELSNIGIMTKSAYRQTFSSWVCVACMFMPTFYKNALQTFFISPRSTYYCIVLL